MPAAPSALVAAVEGPSSVRLSWADSDGLFYVLYAGAGAFAAALALGVVAAGQQAFTARGLTPDTAYSFWVVALSAAPAASVPSAPATATTASESDPDLLSLVAVKDACFDFAVLATDLSEESVYWRDEDTLKAEKPFLLMHVVGPVKMGASDYVVGQTQSGQRSFRLSLEFRSDSKDEAQQLATDLQASFDNPELALILEAAGLSVASTEETQDITVPLETKPEPRIRFDVVLYKSYNKDIAVELIETAPVTAT